MSGTGPEPESAAGHQRRSDDHFNTHSRYWKDLYGERSLWGTIHQERRTIALRWIDELGLPARSRMLDIGCGAGVLAIDLARRGFLVSGIDTSQRMVDLARAEVVAAGLSDRVMLAVADAHDLPFASNAYEVVVALGVLPFLHSPAIAVKEMARLVKPGGYVLLSSDNRYRLNHLVDPRFMPFLAPLKRVARRITRRLSRGERGVPTRFFSYRRLEILLSSAGLTVRRWAVLGFGPFTLLGWRFLAEDASIRLHRRLQDLADRQAPVLRATGAQHIVLARRERRD